MFPFVRKGEERKEEKENNIALKSAFYFSKKEIAKMPDEFKNKITIKLPIPVRQKKNGVFEARFRKYGFNICVSSVDYDKLKAKLFDAFLNYKQPTAQKVSAERAESPLFADVAARWLELKRPTIKANTFEYYVSLFQANILPAFVGRAVADIRQSEIQAFINRYTESGKARTATKLYQTLKAIFDFAVGDELIERSPMRKMKPPIYEEQKGRAFTIEEESELIKRLFVGKVSLEVRNALLFLLYTGIRRSELASVRIEDDFVRVTCAKVRKGYQTRERCIPITPMLARWLPEIDVETVRTVRPDALTQALKRLMPAHHLHELRHTFITRCQTCGVSREVVSVWAGHAADETQTSKVYTHFPREYMKKEGQKVIYNLSPVI